MNTTRFVFNNLIYSLTPQKKLLINLINFRRKVISDNELTILKIIEKKINSSLFLTTSEESLFSSLCNEKQILSNELIQNLDMAFNENYKIPYPFHVTEGTFNITHKCNFKCDYCYQNAYKNENAYKGTMSPENINEIQDFLHLPFFDFVAFNRIIISGGEPLLPNMLHTISKIIGSFPANNKVLFSNGVNIIPLKDKFDFNQLDEFQISLDGPDPIIKNINHYGNVFLQILNGIDYLLSMNKKVSLAIMWSSDLSKYLLSLVSALEKADILNHPLFSVKISTANDYYNDAVLFNEDMYSLETLLNDRAENWETIKHLQASFPISSELNSLSKVIHRPINMPINHRIRRCDISQSLPFVFEPNGEIHWCLCLGKAEGVIGNYKKKTINYDRIKAFASRSIYTNKRCSNCILRFICSGGCILKNIGTNHIPVTDSVCSIFDNDYFWDNLESFI